MRKRVPAWRLRQRAADRICECAAYSYPHRQFGGRCRPITWVREFFAVGKRECVHCINYCGHDCEILTGQERPFHCPELRDYVRYEGIVLYGRARKQFERSQRQTA